MGKLKYRRLVMFLFAMVLLSSEAYSVDIGASPSILRYPDMIKGGYAETSITISTTSIAPISASITKEGDAADWITVLADDSISFSLDSPYTFMVQIEPSPDAQNGNYTGMIKISTEELAEVESGAGSSVIAQIGLLVYIEIIGEEIVMCNAGAIAVEDAEVGDPFRIRATIENQGNVRIRPGIKIDVWDQYESGVLMSRTVFGDNILPTRKATIAEEIDNTLLTGQYFAEVTLIECGMTEMVTFDIVEKGGIADSGELLWINTNEIVYKEEPMPIVPLFKNTGSRQVVATFKGEIRDMKTDKVIEVLESDSIEVRPGESFEFKMYYVPEKEGDYQISGRVVYNNKLTFEEKSRQVKVVGRSGMSKISGSIFYFIGYLILGLVIMILITKIRKARKKRRF